MSKQKTVSVNQQMLIRKPVAEVYEAFVDPAVTTRFWFTRSTGRLEPDATVRWDWEMYGASADVHVTEMVPGSLIRFEWQTPPHPVEFRFDSRPGGTTLMRIAVTGFHGSDDEIVATALDSMGGFSFVLAAAKAWLEHGIEPNIVADHNPDAHV